MLTVVATTLTARVATGQEQVGLEFVVSFNEPIRAVTDAANGNVVALTSANDAWVTLHEFTPDGSLVRTTVIEQQIVQSSGYWCCPDVELLRTVDGRVLVHFPMGVATATGSSVIEYRDGVITAIPESKTSDFGDTVVDRGDGTFVAAKATDYFISCCEMPGDPHTVIRAYAWFGPVSSAGSIYPPIAVLPFDSPRTGSERVRQVLHAWRIRYLEKRTTANADDHFAFQ